MEKVHLKIEEYRKKQKHSMRTTTHDEEQDTKQTTSDITEDETNFNSALSTLLAENNWKLVSNRSGKYKVKFKNSLNYKERINILEIVLEDIRERYFDMRYEYQRIKRKHSKKKRKKRKNGT